MKPHHPYQEDASQHYKFKWWHIFPALLLVGAVCWQPSHAEEEEIGPLITLDEEKTLILDMCYENSMSSTLNSEFEGGPLITNTNGLQRFKLYTLLVDRCNRMVREQGSTYETWRIFLDFVLRYKNSSEEYDM